MKKSIREKVIETHSEHPDWGRRKIAQAIGAHPDTVQTHMQALGIKGKNAPSPTPIATAQSKPAKPIDLVPLAHKLLKNSAISPDSLATSLGVDIDTTDEVLKLLEKQYQVDYSGGLISLEAPPFGYLTLNVLGDTWIRVGLVADTHLACEEERLAELHLQYKLFKKEGITRVFHAGNIVDGYIQKINGASVKCTTVDDQAQYVIDNYPREPGITTYFITGDDHEGWWIKDGFNFGHYLEMMAIEQGREDLVYIGHVEADVEFKTKHGSAIMKIQHPGGGSSYARSYTGQKTIEAFEGGEKPAILVQGHYHVSNYMQDRAVHVIGMPGFQDQTVFARKKRLRMEVGGAILEFMQNPNDGAVTRCRVEFNRYFTREYYKPYLRSDKKIIKGHLTIKT